MNIGDMVRVKAFDEIVPSGKIYCTKANKENGEYLNLDRDTIDDLSIDDYTIISVSESREDQRLLYHLSDTMWVFTEEMLAPINEDDTPDFIPDEELAQFLFEVIV